MSKRDRKKPQALPDWYLWSEVARSVSPIRKLKTSGGMQGKKRDELFEDALGSRRTGMPDVWPPVAAKPQAKMPHRKLAEPKVTAGKVIEPRIHRRLRRGQLPIDATIDLHGMRQIEAHAALCRFVAIHHARGDRTILVITGKGLKKTGYGAIEQHGVLRALLPQWLNEPALNPLVSGWEIAAQGHGGEGAFYVRLKRGGK